ncbi:major facilitator superfamily MFS_1 [Alkaliphilus metalliredigens QYMF]|uniref:Major facilitator superfamily MFS_1 n=1 Tax=Alkaliphilus metalliredigens (strain QYMF) TaxID=293826 RepID=A6TVT0_ALKMQ|nr:MFS transporter [Alkaliphilus metalliredigens]ABR50298.1 major facilitator superfamily MFS_1 [Alkaliphilus metalliredigens QYMF]
MNPGISAMSLNKKDTIGKRNLVLFIAGKFASLFGTQIYSFAIGLYVLNMTGSGLSFASTLIFGMLPRVLFGPIAGVIADRFDRKKIVVGMDLICGLLMLLFYGLSTVNGIRLGYVFLFSFLLTTCNVFFDVSLEASKPNLVDAKHLMRINSLGQSITSIAAISGPFLGGLIFALVDIKLFLLINGISFVLSGVSEYFIQFDYNQSHHSQLPKERKLLWKEMLEGWTFFRSNKMLFNVLSFSILINFILQISITVPLPYILNHVLQMSPEQFGIINGLWPAGMLLGAILLSFLPEKESLYKRLILLMTLFVLLIIAVAIPVTPYFSGYSNQTYFIYYIIIMGFIGFIVALIDIPFMVLIQRQIPNEIRGRVLSLVSTMAIAIAPLGLLISGLIVDHVPTYFLPGVGGIILMIRLIFFANNEEIKKI